MLTRFKNYIDRFKIVKRLGFLPGHYYSPVVMPEEIEKNADAIFKVEGVELVGIDLKEEQQMELLNNLKMYYSDVPFPHNKNEVYRYYFNNPFFSYNSGIQLFTIIRHFKPKHIIEVGSGFSSALMLDVNEQYFQGEIQCTFIEPYPDRLLLLLHSNDKIQTVLIKSKVQDVDTSIFFDLQENDILFIDSSHVSKTGSDLNHLIFKVLPYLNKGVIIHFHDIFYPFEYPKNWVMTSSGFGWNENYLLHAFLINNFDFEILFFNTYMEYFHQDWFKNNMPDCLKMQGGSLFIRKIR